MFDWLKKKKQPENLADEATFPKNHIIRTMIADLIRGAVTDSSMIRQIARPNCAVVLDKRGGVSLRWVSDSDDAGDVVGFAFLNQLSTYKELLEICAQEIKAGTFNDAFLFGPGLMLFDRIAIEAMNEMKRAARQIEGRRES